MNRIQVQKWLNMARWAPSGGNAQPWRVEIQDLESGLLKVSIDPNYRKKPSTLDLDGSASVIGLGAFVETLSQAVLLDGWALEVVEIKSGISFFDTEVFVHVDHEIMNPLSEQVVTKEDSITRRSTNRNKYRRQALPIELKKWMAQLCDKMGIKTVEIEDQNQKKRLIEVLSSLEKIRWSNPVLLDDLLSEIGTNNKLGIPFNQLGVGVFEVLMLRALKAFKTLRRIVRWGFTGEIAKQSIKKPISQAPNYFYLYSDNFSARGFFDLGVVVQRIWLVAEEKGLGFQPLEGHLIGYGALHGDRIPHSPYLDSQKLVIQTIADKYRQYWSIDIKKPLFGFRLGYPLAPSFVSDRKSVEEICINL